MSDPITLSSSALLGLARFCLISIDGNDVEVAGRFKAEDSVLLVTPDCVTYLVPEQQFTLDFDFQTAKLKPLPVKVIMPGRLPEDREVETHIVLSKRLELNMYDIYDFLEKSALEPMPETDMSFVAPAPLDTTRLV